MKPPILAALLPAAGRAGSARRGLASLTSLLALAALLLPAAAGASPSRPEQSAPDLRVPSGQTVVLSGTHVLGELRVEAGGQLTVDDYVGRPPDGGEPGGRLEIRARRIVVEAGGRISADGAGFRGLAESKGEGPGGGEGGVNAFMTEAWPPAPVFRPFGAGSRLALGIERGGDRVLHPTSSGAGGGHGGRGGDGVQDGQRGAWKGGPVYGERETDPQLGSGGGAAPSSHHEPRSLKGGDGGGAILLAAEEIRIDGEVSADGEEGESAEFDAGGGGSGGLLRIEAGRLALSGKLAARGGRGGRASNVGGSGGGGRITVIWAEGALASENLIVRPGNGPCPDPEELSPRACEGKIELRYVGPRELFLPFLSRNACIGPNRKAIALVMDVSGSMAEPTRAGRPAIAAAVEAASTFLGRLTPEDRVALVAFDSQARTVTPLTADRDRVQASLSGLETRSGSRLDAGLNEGRRALGDARPGERKILVMLTDGLPSQVEAEAVREAATDLRGAGIRIYAIGIGAEIDRSLLAEITGDPSRVLVESDPEKLDALYHAIAEREGCPSP